LGVDFGGQGEGIENLGVGIGEYAELGLGSRVQDSGIRVPTSGFRVQGSGYRAQGSGFRVEG
jgi:hypothetical protein